MNHFAQINPCYLIAPGFPISLTVIDDRITSKCSHFARGSRFSCERISNIYYLKYQGNYISFVNNAAVVVDEIVALDDLVYIEPYFNGIFHLKYKYDYLSLDMESLSLDNPIKLQWAIFDIFGSNHELNDYIDAYDFLGPYQYQYASVDGFNLLNPTRSFFLIPDGDFNKHLNYNQEENLFKFIRFEYNISIRLMFRENDGVITIYSEEFGYLQAGYDEENEALFPVFSHDHYEFPIILERARHFTTFYLKYNSSYIKLTHRSGAYYGIFTEDRDEASVFQAISDY
ncbi:hypothetical protein CONCODRAFT_71692 [Conidiobolus coronatus NRRL 28638]|uniref:Uncharacterized protein n=1 Tax=Conidiobolus coronatus (strain ATCC 28846 / CBS 209.66 / NRRL 28638) TaxID=796925 RepID=A0A137P294_CONC2|nr:hypothetical protein CONCODRAFT_71692 [Conidiobolus coronatus NRRL 28638]|eukprot:KXN69167.1 hypothetical protein CONCODRAFT_71692 [Conidiobolus coronatus NRRL 28638]